ncbi:MAG TPA: flavin reductase family protein [Bryobacteraceae bacterium]|nr:flavin reductase family protein [Bryobacteraceae bacterium]
MSSNLPSPSSGNVEKAEFCRACAQFATGVAVATVRDAEGAPHGITINSFTSVSLEPPLVLICVGHSASILQRFRVTGYFGLNMLSEHQQHLSEHFARRAEDRFESVPWYPGATGVPLIPDVLGTVECRVVRAVTAGDHDILLGEVLRTEVRGGRPLIYYGSAYRRLDP